MSTVTAPKAGRIGKRNLAGDRSDTKDSFTMATENRTQLAWGVIFWLTLVHIGALISPWTFTWEGLVLAVFLHWVTGGLGICLGFHRLLTHSSFSTYAPVRWLCALLGGLAGEGSAVDWVANHRKHHALSDQPGDPHSPHEGAWWSHILWLAWNLPKDEHEKHIRKWAPDMAKDPVIVWIGNLFIPIHIVTGLMIIGAGYWYGENVATSVGGTAMATSFVTWGIFLRLFGVLHATWFVNSASHMWGYTNYETTDDSKNNWWVALITYGEGWHNNHHAYPRMALHGHKWWEIDTTWAVIRAMRMCGLAWDVVDYKHKNEKH
jgi:stearoyl-CoA desaturase (delta-9 desaturase)